MRFEASVAYSDRSKGLFGAVAVLVILICFKVSKFCVQQLIRSIFERPQYL